MRALPLVWVVVCSCVVPITAEGLRPEPVLSSVDLPRLPVQLSDRIPNDASCVDVPVSGWRGAVTRSVEALGTPIASGRPGIVLELMSPACIAGRTSIVQVHYRARLLGPKGEELAATNGLASGTPFGSLYWSDGVEGSMSLALELATQQAIVPLLEKAKPLSPSSSR